jgi:hypothetical protein
MKSLLIKSQLFGDLVIPADDFEESRDIWDSLDIYLDINVFGEDDDDIQANIYPVKDGLTCTSKGVIDMCLEVIENVELIEDLTS